MESIIGSPRRADITFHHNGCIDITSRVAKSLGIKPGDSIGIMRDGYEYYLKCHHHVESASGFWVAVCRPASRKGSGYMRAYCKQLTAPVLEACAAHKKVGLPCGEIVSDRLGNKLMPIIMRLIIHKS